MESRPANTAVATQRRAMPVALGAMRLVRLPFSLAIRGVRWFRLNRRMPTVAELRHFGRKISSAVQYESQFFEKGLQFPPSGDRFAAWLRVNQANERAARHISLLVAEKQGDLVKISVVMPVYNPPPNYLDIAIQSVLAQRYQNWELCIADDASSDGRVKEILEGWARFDVRIKVVFRRENGNISAATNAAAALASGEFLLFLDQDDELEPDCLAEIALRLAETPDADMAYTDDDKVDAQGRRFDPQFKPDWSPELLLSYMYISHAFVVRRSLFEALGGFRVGYEGSQDYDFALRAAERARGVVHVPRILYHWRAVPGSTAATSDAKPGSIDAGLRAVSDALARRHVQASAYHPEWARRARLGIYSHQFPDVGPSVTVVIPTKNQHAILDRCLKSLEKTTYRNYSVLIVDNESDDPQSISYLSSVKHRVERIPNPGPSFSFAHINNRAALLADSKYLLFLNNDTEVIEPRWLSQMVGYAQMRAIGAVGARLIFPDGRIQHAGIVHGLYQGMAGPAFKLLPSTDNGYLWYTRVVRDYMAVTAACMLTQRELFLKLGGFDERNFAVGYNDVDYCYRLIGAGFRCVYCADAELRHHENYSRGQRDDAREEGAFRRKYKSLRDPWYNPNLSLDNERFEVQPRHPVLHSLQPVRALMYSHNLNLEGASNSMYELAVGLRDAGAVEPLVISPEDGPLRRSYEESGIPVTRGHGPTWAAYTEKLYGNQIRLVAALARDLGADVVYANTMLTFVAIDAARRLGLPAIWNPRESEPWRDYYSHVSAPIARRALRCFEYPYRVVFVAQATRRVWEVFNSQHNFTVVHNGLKLDRLERQRAGWPRALARTALGVAPSEVAVLLLGTVCERKGQLDLARAIERLPKSVLDRVKLFIVGDRPGHYSRQLHATLARLPKDLRCRVEVVAETEETAKYYSAADVFVCTSRIESFPRVTLEAMAYGLPIVTTPAFGITEQVRDGVNALFYPPGDAAALADRLTKIIGDDALRCSFAKNSPPMLARLNSFEEMVERYAEIFREAYLSTVPKAE
jgi:GT2 family glycosyltransferase